MPVNVTHSAEGGLYMQAIISLVRFWLSYSKKK